jgi:hypothetical protein
MQRNIDIYHFQRIRGEPKEKGYVSYGVTCSEAEVDILTGERIILRSDILFDCGERYTTMNTDNPIWQLLVTSQFQRLYFYQYDCYTIVRSSFSSTVFWFYLINK